MKAQTSEVLMICTNLITFVRSTTCKSSTGVAMKCTHMRYSVVIRRQQQVIGKRDKRTELETMWIFTWNGIIRIYTIKLSQVLFLILNSFCALLPTSTSVAAVHLSSCTLLSSHRNLLYVRWLEREINTIFLLYVWILIQKLVPFLSIIVWIIQKSSLNAIMCFRFTHLRPFWGM